MRIKSKLVWYYYTGYIRTDFKCANIAIKASNHQSCSFQYWISHLIRVYSKQQMPWCLNWRVSQKEWIRSKRQNCRHSWTQNAWNSCRAKKNIDSIQYSNRDFACFYTLPFACKRTITFTETLRFYVFGQTLHLYKLPHIEICNESHSLFTLQIILSRSLR